MLHNLGKTPVDQKPANIEEGLANLPDGIDAEALIAEIAAAVEAQEEMEQVDEPEPEPTVAIDQEETPTSEDVVVTEPVSENEAATNEALMPSSEQADQPLSRYVDQELPLFEEVQHQEDEVRAESPAENQPVSSESTDAPTETEAETKEDESLSAVHARSGKLANEVEQVHPGLEAEVLPMPKVDEPVSKPSTETVMAEELESEAGTDVTEVFEETEEPSIDFPEVDEPVEEKVEVVSEISESADEVENPAPVIDENIEPENIPDAEQIEIAAIKGKGNGNGNGTNNALVWSELGNVFYNAGAYEEAQMAYKKAIELDAEFGIAFHNLALTHVRKGQYGEAIELYRQSIELLNDEAAKATSWNDLGDVFRVMNEYEQAINAYRMADQLQPDKSALKNLTDNGLLSNSKTAAAD